MWRVCRPPACCLVLASRVKPHLRARILSRSVCGSLCLRSFDAGGTLVAASGGNSCFRYHRLPLRGHLAFVVVPAFLYTVAAFYSRCVRVLFIHSHSGVNPRLIVFLVTGPVVWLVIL